MTTLSWANPSAATTGIPCSRSLLGNFGFNLTWRVYVLSVAAGSIGQLLFGVGTVLFLILARNLQEIFRGHLIS
jgi:hypothetical protein